MDTCKKEDKVLNIVTVGHVDHGKSTVLGRLLADTGSLPKGKLEQVRAMCERSSKPFEYAFLLDALKDEQAQGITIDSARIFFKTKKRNYLFIDAPGHIEFLRNMVTGASRAEAALLVIDAKEGVQENSRRHAYLLSMLGIKQVAVLVNKMDLVDYSEKRFREIVDEYQKFLMEVRIEPAAFIPVSGIKGDNISKTGGSMRWYKGESLLGAVEAFQNAQKAFDSPFRMPVQDVYKFTKAGDERRIVAGTVTSGKLAVGDEVLFYPSGKKSIVKSIEAFNRKPQREVGAGQATGLTLTEQLYLTRGEIAINEKEPRPHITSLLKVSLFWLSKQPLKVGEEYIFKAGTTKVTAALERIERVIDPSRLGADLSADRIERNMVADCVVRLNKPIAFDLVDGFLETSRFVIVRDYRIAGGGIIREALPDEQSWLRDKVLLRNYKWERSMIPYTERSGQYGQVSTLIFITGERDIGKKRIARRLEKTLFGEGKLVYFLGIGNILYGLDADIKGISDSREEHIRRLAEVAHIMLEAGMILIVTAVELTKEDMQLIKTAINPEHVKTIWIGRNVTTDIDYDFQVAKHADAGAAVNSIMSMLKEKGVISESHS